ncbi:S-layer homology domain-containing protein [Candidatus Peribacteria bacterium]|nr:S-layer homology domain-containing protein [Candidatus Peribacteria bacterium]
MYATPLFALGFLAFLTPLAAQAASPSAVCELPLQYFAAEGYVQSTTGFQPAEPLTRAAALKLITAVSEEPLQTAPEKPWADVPAEAWFAPYVAHATATEVLRWQSGSSLFRPADTMTRAEFLTLALRGLRVTLPETLPDATAADLPTGEWYSDALRFAMAQRVLLPDATGQVYPSQTVTRCEGILWLYRLLLRGQAVDLPLLMRLAENNLVEALQAIEQDDIPTAALHVDTATMALQTLDSVVQHSPVLEGAKSTANSVRYVVEAYERWRSGFLDGTILSAQQAWQYAAAAGQADDSFTALSAKLQGLAHHIATTAREAQALTIR